VGLVRHTQHSMTTKWGRQIDLQQVGNCQDRVDLENVISDEEIDPIQGESRGDKGRQDLEK
jgi:hypothetical protein